MPTFTDATPASSAPCGAYACRGDLENLWGIENIRQWSNLDNEATGADTVRIAEAINQADAELHDRFRHSAYVVPFTFATTAAKRRVIYWVAVKAGLWLFQPRKTAAQADKPKGVSTDQLAQRVEQEIRDVLAGIRVLDAGRNFEGPRGPIAVPV